MIGKKQLEKLAAKEIRKALKGTDWNLASKVEVIESAELDGR